MVPVLYATFGLIKIVSAELNVRLFFSTSVDPLVHVPRSSNTKVAVPDTTGTVVCVYPPPNFTLYAPLIVVAVEPLQVSRPLISKSELSV